MTILTQRRGGRHAGGRPRVGHRPHTRALTAALGGLIVLSLGSVAPARAEATAATVERELSDARTRLRTTERRRAATVDRLADISRRRAALDRELAELDARLSAARDRLALRRRELAQTMSGLVALDRYDQALYDQQRGAHDRVRTSISVLTAVGRLGMVNAVLGAESIAEAGHVTMYARVIAERHAAAVRDARRRHEATQATTRKLEARRDDVATRSAAVEEERDRVGALVAQKAQLRDRLTDQARRQREILAAIESDRDRHAELVADLEAESARLTRRLLALTTAGAPPRDTKGGIVWPTDGPVTSPFGYRTHPISGIRRLHAGVDVGAAAGAPIRAARGGVVVTAGWLGGYGNAVVIDHGAGLSTLYAHQAVLTVAVGDIVERGQVIGEVGATGFVTGPHLHFEIRVDGVPTDPAAYR